MSDGDKKSDAFGVTDHSATAPFLKKLVSEQVIRIIPSAYSPNALTLTGGFLALCSCLSIWLFMDDMRAGSPAGKMWMMTSALLLIFYGVFDQLDGMQARKTGRSSPFGDFLDHWVDTIIANSLTLPIMVMISVSNWQIWLMVFTTALAFWAHNWETRNTNYRHLPLVGGLESIWTALVIMSLTSVFGIGVWQATWGGVTLLNAFYWLGLAALIWVVIKSLLTSTTRISDYLGFILATTPLSIWLLLFAPQYQDDLTYVWLGYITLGLMATLLTGNLMRHLWLGGEYKKFDLLMPAFGILMLTAGYRNDMPATISEIEQWLITGIFALSALRVAYQGISSYREISTAPQ